MSLVPTLEQLGPGVRMWSDAIGITGEHEDFTGQDRHLLSNSTVFGLAKDLASMTHAQRVNAYCDLIRLLGVLYADLMRAMLRAEEIVDEEVLLQVTTEAVRPSMAPHLVPAARMEDGNHTMEEDEGKLGSRRGRPGRGLVGPMITCRTCRWPQRWGRPRPSQATSPGSRRTLRAWSGIRAQMSSTTFTINSKLGGESGLWRLLMSRGTERIGFGHFWSRTRGNRPASTTVIVSGRKQGGRRWYRCCRSMR